MDVKERKKLALVYKIIMLEPNLAIFRQLKNIEYFENVFMLKHINPAHPNKSRIK